MPNSSNSNDENDFWVRIGGGGKRDGGTTGRATSSLLGGRLTKALARKGGMGKFARGGSAGMSSRGFGGDMRQRVIAKVSFHNHGGSFGGGGGGGGKLLAHANYLQRDGAAREGEQGHFYDREHDQVEHARDTLDEWSRDDPRHFRIMLAPESGARLAAEPGGLMDFTRDAMAGMERDLGVGLDWLAVEHHNTDNPHVHVIVRGIRGDGIELRIPRDYIGHGLRENAREVATGLLGERSIADERLRLEREIGSPSLTRLDKAIEERLGHGREVLIQSLGKDHSPAFGDALKARARELEQMGLAKEVRRNVLAFERDWKERLEAARPLDVRRSLSQAHLYERNMGRVTGQVVELGPRGESPDRGLLVVETPDHGRVLVNTSLEAIKDLQKGSLVALEPAGKRPEIERLAFHPVREQMHAIADTALDRELERISRGDARQLPELPNVDRALVERARMHLETGLGSLDDDGRFVFRDGARQHLHDLELIQTGRGLAAQSHYSFREPERGGRELDGENWKMRGEVELHSGKTAILERRLEIALAPLGKDLHLDVGKEVSLKLSRSPQLELKHTLEIAPPSIGRALGLSR